jgi:hypothetical protein
MTLAVALRPLQRRLAETNFFWLASLTFTVFGSQDLGEGCSAET